MTDLQRWMNRTCGRLLELLGSIVKVSVLRHPPGTQNSDKSRSSHSTNLQIRETMKSRIFDGTKEMSLLFMSRRVKTHIKHMHSRNLPLAARIEYPNKEMPHPMIWVSGL